MAGQGDEEADADADGEAGVGAPRDSKRCAPLPSTVLDTCMGTGTFCCMTCLKLRGTAAMLVQSPVRLRLLVQTCRRGSDAGSPAAEGSSERLRQLLNRSGLESDGEEDGGGAAESDDDDDDADEDLDAMASGLQTRARAANKPPMGPRVRESSHFMWSVALSIGDAGASQVLRVCRLVTRN